MSAFIGYSFGFIEPGATVGVYLHGFPVDQFASIDVRAVQSPARPSAFQASADVQLPSVAQHVDGTLAHTIIVTNTSVSNGAPPTPVVNVAVFLESLE